MGRDFLIDVMKAQRANGNTSPAETFRLVVSAEIPELEGILAGTPSEVLIKGAANERLLANIRYEASRAMRSWQLLKPEGDFSVREWIRSGSGILFLTYRESEMDTLKNLIGAPGCRSRSGKPSRFPPTPTGGCGSSPTSWTAWGG